MFDQIKNATESVREAFDTGRARLREKEETRDTTRRAARHVAEARPDVVAWVDRHRSIWLRTHAGAWISGQTGGRGGFLRHGKPPGIGLAGLDTPADVIGFLCAGFHDQMVAGVIAVLERALEERGTTALSSADRTRLLAELDADIAELEAADEAAVDEARAAGFEVSHLPAVARRREETQHADAARARRQALQDALDEQIARVQAPPRAGHSPDLETNALDGPARH